jgi:hypothetical protein
LATSHSRGEILAFLEPKSIPEKYRVTSFVQSSPTFAYFCHQNSTRIYLQCVVSVSRSARASRKLRQRVRPLLPPLALVLASSASCLDVISLKLSFPRRTMIQILLNARSREELPLNRKPVRDQKKRHLRPFDPPPTFSPNVVKTLQAVHREIIVHNGGKSFAQPRKM